MPLCIPGWGGAQRMGGGAGCGGVEGG